ncbi:MAG: serine--tRNA ligase [Alphaproteobacteria bacterium]|nr:MAG: serine--tRNA ligase [Alphaproteobacteria bacterium]
MLDITHIREDTEEIARRLSSRGEPVDLTPIRDLDARRRQLMTELQELQARRNAASREIGAAMKAGERERAEELKREVATLKDRMAALEEAVRTTGEELEAAMLRLPNLPDEDVPIGADENDNLELRRWGDVPEFAFEPKPHYELGEALDGMDFETAALLSGARFVVLEGEVARLHRAIGQFMIDLHTREHGYREVAPPLLVREAALIGTGQLPKFAEDLYRAGDEHWLIPTAEVPLTNLWRERIVEEETLPRRVTALTACFRAEAGAAGRDTRGMLRQHQFEKVELVSLTRPEDSADELERMTRCAEEVLRRLEIPYRVMLLCTGDMGFSAAKTYDIEAWLPGQARYREISSCSNCRDFQARRMRLRIRAAGEKKTRLAHTLNGSGVAVGRALIAVMENHQQADGSIRVPPALRPYLDGLERIGG